jgi:hypothetical protein
VILGVDRETLEIVDMPDAESIDMAEIGRMIGACAARHEGS